MFYLETRVARLQRVVAVAEAGGGHLDRRLVLPARRRRQPRGYSGVASPASSLAQAPLGRAG